MQVEVITIRIFKDKNFSGKTNLFCLFIIIGGSSHKRKPFKISKDTCQARIKQGKYLSFNPIMRVGSEGYERYWGHCITFA